MNSSEGVGPAGPVNSDPQAARVDLEIDCRGMVCPLPVIELGKRYAEVPIGGLIGVIATDTAAATDIPAWCRMRGQVYTGRDSAADGSPRYVVRRVS